ncbi:MAG TPA: ferritin-like domain-containing protein [Ktedonobacteraceae bacterium]|jgi:hypothetical protein|nr:ferritin-like domain-containing protein [Ktedonobacteraceae bacterium]
MEKSNEGITLFSSLKSRRSVLRGALAGAAGATGLAVGGTLLARNGTVAHAAPASTCPVDSITTILSVAATAEQLAVTFYANGIENAGTLGISGANFEYLEGAIVEEQLHRDLLVKAGGTPVTGTFSFPNGMGTFQHLDKFIATLDMLETAFESAYIAAIREFADMNRSDLAELAAQICTIEAEHRAIGRSIDPSIPLPNNWAFTPVYVKSVSDAVNVLTQEGFLSPKKGNSYKYERTQVKEPDVIHRMPYVVPCS